MLILCTSGELPLEELLKLYNMEQRRSATPETDIEGETSVEGEASVKEEDMETGEQRPDCLLQQTGATLVPLSEYQNQMSNREWVG